MGRKPGKLFSRLRPYIFFVGNKSKRPQFLPNFYDIKRLCKFQPLDTGDGDHHSCCVPTVWPAAALQKRYQTSLPKSKNTFIIPTIRVHDYFFGWEFDLPGRFGLYRAGSSEWHSHQRRQWRARFQASIKGTTPLRAPVQ